MDELRQSRCCMITDLVAQAAASVRVDDKTWKARGWLMSLLESGKTDLELRWTRRGSAPRHEMSKLSAAGLDLRLATN